ncbi:MAG: transcription-repair coupling factor, partial [Gammaproteobacteria bacterium]|nr:transcription-repair coupling factor [Gammaproteobacteria bacterium]
MSMPLLNPKLPDDRHPLIRWGQLYGGSAALALAEAAQASVSPLLLVTPDAREAERFAAELRFYLGESWPVMRFPDWETLPYDLFSPHPDIVSERLATLAQLPDLKHGVIIVAAGTLMQRLAPAAHILGGSLLLRTGERLDREAMRRRLTAAGYAAVTQVMEHGEFAVRGALLDIFPMGSTTPLRIDLLDEEIESIRHFDTETQLSQDKLEEIKLLPAREFPLDEAGIRGFRQRYRARFEGDPQKNPVYRDVSNGLAPGGVEYYAPLFFDGTATLFEYLPTGTTLVLQEGAGAALQQAWRQIAERHEQRRHDLERPLLLPEELWLSPEEAQVALDTHARIQLHSFECTGADAVNYGSVTPPPLRVETRAAEPVAKLLAFLRTFPGRVLLAAESAGRREYLLELLAHRDLQPTSVDGWNGFLASQARLALCVAPLERGLYLPAAGVAVIAEQQLFGERAHVPSRRTRRRDPAAIIRDLTALAPGAPVVHAEHGVGRYLGLQTLELDHVQTDFLALEYAEGAKLYVPVSALHLISR